VRSRLKHPAILALVLGVAVACGSEIAPTPTPVPATNRDAGPENRPVTLASSLGGALSVDAEYLYVANESGVYRIPKDAATEVTAPERFVPAAMAAAAWRRSNAAWFWVFAGDLEGGGRGNPGTLLPDSGAVFGWDPSGATITVARPVDQPSSLDVDDVAVYWATPGGIFAAAKTSGAAVRRVVSEDARRVAIHGSDLYFTRATVGELRRVPKDATDGASELVASVSIDARFRIGDEGMLLFGAGPGLRFRTHSGELTPLGESGYVTDAVPDGDFIVYAVPSDGLFRVRRDGAGAPEQLTPLKAESVAVDDRAYYFTFPEAGTVRRLAR
jgi:hypothetical protein